jgi:hypothetical protein
MADLRMKVTQQAWWQQKVDLAANIATRQRYNETLMGQLDALINPPTPPEPEIVYFAPEPEEETFCGVKIPRWR